jgi:flagella basal body P-ring formation protein FlgA
MMIDNRRFSDLSPSPDFLRKGHHFIFTAIFFFFSSMPSLAASLPALNQRVTLSHDIVRLGDLLTNSGEKAHIALFRSPDPGQTGKVPVKDILDLARTNGIRGIETPNFLSVSVTRSSKSVNREEMIALLREAFAKRADVNQADTLAITLADDVDVIHFEENSAAQLTVNSLTWSAGGGPFQAEIAFGDSTREISGTAQDVVQALVLTRDIARDAVLGPEDLSLEQRPRTQVTSVNALNDDIPAIGKSLRRPMRAGQMLNFTDLVEPELVKRAAMVTLVHRKPGMVLTARGQALRSGRRGETISVMNLLSKRMIEGTVTGPDEVTVTPVQNPLLQANASRNR